MQTSETLRCPSCDWQGTEALLYRSGAHVRADCPECGRYIKFVAQHPPEEAQLHFGKYRGERVVDVANADPDYLRWVLDNVVISRGLRSSIRMALGIEP